MDSTLQRLCAAAACLLFLITALCTLQIPNVPYFKMHGKSIVFKLNSIQFKYLTFLVVLLIEYVKTFIQTQ